MIFDHWLNLTRETSKKINDVMSENLNVIVIFPIFGQFEAIFRTILGSQIPDA